MMEITAKLVKKFRDTTGLGMMESKKLLKEVRGDFNEALKLFNLRNRK